jgi:hypothetical protein
MHGVNITNGNVFLDEVKVNFNMLLYAGIGQGWLRGRRR